MAGMLEGFLTKGLPIAGSLLGGNISRNADKNAANMMTPTPFNISTGGTQTSVEGNQGTATLSPELQKIQQMLQGGATGALGADQSGAGGFAGLNPQIFAALQGADAFTGQDLSQFFLPEQGIRDAAMSNLGMFSGDTGQSALGQQFLGAAGGALQGLGSMNPEQATQNTLAQLRAQARPFEDRQEQGLEKKLFARGMLGSTGGSQQLGDLAQRQSADDLGRILAARGETRAGQQNQLSLAQGAGQAGSGLMGADFGLRDAALGRALGIDQTGFDRGLQTMGAQSGLATDRFNRALSAFQTGQGAIDQNINRGLQQLMASQGIDQQSMNQLFGGIQLGNQRAQAAAGAGAATQAAGKQGGSMVSGLLGGLAKAAPSILGLFSDRRLKDNIRELEFQDDVGLMNYSWDWNDKAKELGIDQQPTEGFIAQEVEEKYPNAIIKDAKTGYLMVNYGAIE